MKYLSLFSGIGGFELAIQRVFPDAECIGYSEIHKAALRVYKEHYPTHKNLGDVTSISQKQVKALVENGCDLIVAGFPCKNLSSLSGFVGDNSGLDGPKSGLFWNLIQILRTVYTVCPNVHFIIENNASMNKKSMKIITQELRKIKPVFLTRINASEIGVQSRDRLFWSTFEVKRDNWNVAQTWRDILEDKNIVCNSAITESCIGCFNRTLKGSNPSKKLRKVKYLSNGLSKLVYEPMGDDIIEKTRWQLSFVSDTMDFQDYTPYPVGKSRPVITSAGTNNIIIDRRFGNDDQFLVRRLTSVEKERLFGFPDNWTLPAESETARGILLGNTVVTTVIEKILMQIQLYLL